MYFKRECNKIKRQPTEWEKITALNDKELASIVYKNSKGEKNNIPIKEHTEDLNRHFSKENTE